MKPLAVWKLLAVQSLVLFATLQSQAQEAIALTPEKIAELSRSASEVELLVPDHNVGQRQKSVANRIEKTETAWTARSANLQAQITELSTPVQAQYRWPRTWINPTYRRDNRLNERRLNEAADLKWELKDLGEKYQAKMSRLREQIPIVTAEEVANLQQVKLPDSPSKAQALLERYAGRGARLVRVLSGGAVSAGIYLVFESTFVPSEAMAQEGQHDIQISDTSTSLD